MQLIESLRAENALADMRIQNLEMLVLDVGWVAFTGGYIGIMENEMETTIV